MADHNTRTTAQAQAAHVYFNGKIHCFDDERRTVEAMMVRDGRIVALGSRQDVFRGFGIDQIEIDLQGCHVVPGFIDAHCHFALGAFAPLWEDLSGGIIEGLSRTTDRTADGWVRGRQPPHWGPHPAVADLDAIISDRPLIVVEQGYHGCFLNSLALSKLREASGGDRFAALMERPETRGRTTLTNLPPDEADVPPHSAAVFETAMGWAENFTRDWFQLKYASSMLDLVEQRSLAFRDHGVTTVCDAALTPMLESLLEEALSSGYLPIHVVSLAVGRNGLFAPPWDRLDPNQEQAEGRICPIGIKLFVDGGRQCLVELVDGTIGGHAYYSRSELASLMRAIHSRGWIIACHAVGNKAIDEAVAAFATLPSAPPGRLRLEHAALTDIHAVDQMTAVNAIPVVQPHWILSFGQRWLKHPYEGMRFLPLRTLRDAGLTVAGSSDATDGPPVPPLQSIRAAVFRSTDEGVLDPDQCLTPYEAFEMFTKDAAIACGLHGRKGSLYLGSDADFVLLDGDPFSPGFLSKDRVRVLKTIIGGSQLETRNTRRTG